jgi:hypothetical protein
MVFFDGLSKIPDEGTVENKAIYVALASIRSIKYRH